MIKQVAFIVFLAVAFSAFGYTIRRLMGFFKLTKGDFKIDRLSERINTTLLVAFGQSKIMRRPVIGFLHALVYWGFMVITLGTAEMMIDGIFGTERILGVLGPVYTFISCSGDIFAAIIAISCIIFLFRRIVLKVKRFDGVEMNAHARTDANIALSIIFFLMVSLLGMNIGYIADMSVAAHEIVGCYPVSSSLVGLINGLSPTAKHVFHEVNWWLHIGLVFGFMNMLPYSKHFHVFMSMPNVFLTDLKPYTKIHNMPHVTKEVKLMLDPNTAFATTPEGEPQQPLRFGIKDIEDVTWKNYADSLTCTQCGRCTSVCPANTTGKLLSPRKILVEVRKRMNDKGPGLVKDANFSDGKSLVGDYITAEELWACTTCNACVQECPVNIDHVSIILDARRYLVMEESAAPQELNGIFTNIENNGAPWQFSPEDRLKWTEGLEINA